MFRESGNGYTPAPENLEKNVEAEALPAHFDALIVLGKNWRELPEKDADPNNEKVNLSLESKMTARAALEMYQNGRVGQIILSGGKTAGENWPSEAEAMKDYMVLKYAAQLKKESNLEDVKAELDKLTNAVILEEQSIDTKTNAVEVKEIFDAHKLKNAALLTVGFHLDRAQNEFSNNGITTQGFASEEVMKTYCPMLYERFYDQKYRHSPRHLKQEVWEKVIRGFLAVGLGGSKFSAKYRHGK